MRLFDGQGPRYSTITRLQLVGPLPLAAPPAAISMCTVLRCLARVRIMPPIAAEVEGGDLGEGGEEGAGGGAGGGEGGGGGVGGGVGGGGGGGGGAFL